MGMNGPVRAVRGERIYPLSAMTANTKKGIVDVASFCKSVNMTPTALMVTAAIDEDGDMYPFVGVDIVPMGQDDNHHYVMPLFTCWIYDIAVKKIHLNTQTEGIYMPVEEVFILGINP